MGGWRDLVPAVLAAVLLAGCGSGAPQEPGGDASTPVETPPAADDWIACVPGAVPVEGAAAGGVDEAVATAAYCEVAAFALDEGLTELMVPSVDRAVGDYGAVLPSLTRPARRTWRALVSAHLGAGEADATSRISELTLHDFDRVPDGYLLEADGPHDYGSRVGPATVALLSGPATDPHRLQVELVLTTGLVLEERGDDSGRHSLLALRRRLTYEVTRASGTAAWRIADWSAVDRVGQVRLVSAGAG